MLRAQSPSFVVTFLLASLLTLHLAASQQCSTSDSDDLDSQPKDACSLNVTITPLDNCDANITERMTFPHTIVGKIKRDIPCLEDEEDVENPIVTVNNSNMTVSKVDKKPNAFYFEFGTNRSDSQITYELRYVLQNAVRIFDTSCDEQTKDPDPDKRVIRWRAPQLWSIKVESLNISINLPSGLQEVFNDDVTNDPYYHVFDFNCSQPKPLKCCPEKPPNSRPLVITFLVIIAVIIIIIVLFCFVRRKRASAIPLES